jgi:hypothetical protein
VDVTDRGKDSRHLKSENSNEKFKTGTVIADQEFQENFLSGADAHVISGVATYDFAVDTSTDDEGYTLVEAHSGYVQLDANLVHTVNAVKESVSTVHSEDLHRSACGFDEGVITIKSAEKTVIVTFLACGKKSIIVR